MRLSHARRLITGVAGSFFILYFAHTLAAAQQWSVSSPDGSITAVISNTTNLSYSVTKGASVVISSSPLGLDGFSDTLSFVSAQTVPVTDSFPLYSGKTSFVNYSANRLTLTFTNTQSQTINVVFQISNDAAAFRYVMPGSGTRNTNSEMSGYRLPAGTSIWAQQWANNYEGFYNVTTLTAGSALAYPLLFKTSAGVWGLLTEAYVTDNYGQSHLSVNNSDTTLLTTIFDPGESLPLESTLPFNFPWRVIILGSLANIVESNVVTALTPAPPAADYSWIKPGRVAWSWWSDNASPSSLLAQEAYVDFAAEMGWEYILVDSGWDASWIPQLMTYAKSKNVGVILWYFYGSFTDWSPSGWLPSYTAAANTFQQLKTWGCAGAKIDFFDSDSQTTNKIKEAIFQAGYDKKMLFNFHGASKSMGEIRRAPQFLTEEGVQGAEHFGNPSSHTTTLPFTRNAVGPMDYTPVTFSQRGSTTYGHQLAEAVVYESGWQHFADSSGTYRSIPAAMDLLKTVPVAWDEIKLLAGQPADHVVIARRKGNDWYVGAMTVPAKSFSFPLSSFASGSYQATFFVDGASDTAITTTTQAMTAADTISFTTRANGGAVVRLKSVSTNSAPPAAPKNLRVR